MARAKLIENNGVVGKCCSECSNWKPLDEFYIRKEGVGGKEAKCKECKKKFNNRKSKTYYEKHKEKILDYQSEYREENREYFREKNKERFQEKKEEIYEYRKQLRARKNQNPSH
jgi:hypothetical protein